MGEIAFLAGRPYSAGQTSIRTCSRSSRKVAYQGGVRVEGFGVRLVSRSGGYRRV